MPLCLNVGCHDIHLADFINIDLDPAMKPDLICDATKLKEVYQEETIDFIYCGHFLEHLKIDQIIDVIKDFWWLLRPYGSIAVVVPDYTKMTNNIDMDEQIILADGQHKSLFTQERLFKLFSEIGFTTFPVPTELLPWCRFPQVTWQSSIIAIKNNKINFTTG